MQMRDTPNDWRKSYFVPQAEDGARKCKRWIKNCGRPHGQLNLERVNKHKAVCSSVSKLVCLFLDTAFSTIEINLESMTYL